MGQLSLNIKILLVRWDTLIPKVYILSGQFSIMWYKFIYTKHLEETLQLKTHVCFTSDLPMESIGN